MKDDIYYGIINENQKVTGIVTKIEGIRAIVDIGTSHKGYLYFPELSYDESDRLIKTLKIGDELDCIVERVNEYGGTVHLRPTHRCNQQLKAKLLKMNNNSHTDKHATSNTTNKKQYNNDENSSNKTVVTEVMSLVQENLTQMKPALISEIAISVYSQLEKGVSAENAGLKRRVNELEERVKYLETMIDKLKF